MGRICPTTQIRPPTIKAFCHIAEEILLWRHLFDKLFVFFFARSFFKLCITSYLQFLLKSTCKIIERARDFPCRHAENYKRQSARQSDPAAEDRKQVDDFAERDDPASQINARKKPEHTGRQEDRENEKVPSEKDRRTAPRPYSSIRKNAGSLLSL